MKSKPPKVWFLADLFRVLKICLKCNLRRTNLQGHLLKNAAPCCTELLLRSMNYSCHTHALSLSSEKLTQLRERKKKLRLSHSFRRWLNRTRFLKKKICELNVKWTMSDLYSVFLELRILNSCLQLKSTYFLILLKSQ